METIGVATAHRVPAAFGGPRPGHTAPHAQMAQVLNTCHPDPHQAAAILRAGSHLVSSALGYLPEVLGQLGCQVGQPIGLHQYLLSQLRLLAAGSLSSQLRFSSRSWVSGQATQILWGPWIVLSCGRNGDAAWGRGLVDGAHCWVQCHHLYGEGSEVAGSAQLWSESSSSFTAGVAEVGGGAPRGLEGIHCSRGTVQSREKCPFTPHL